MEKRIPLSPSGKLMSIAKSAPADAYRDMIRQVVDNILSTLGEDQVRSIVLRGSIACHTDIPGISDLDMVIFLHHEFEDAQRMLADLAARETLRWKELVSLIDLSCAQFNLLTTRIDHNRLYLNLKLTGVTLWGEDLVAQLPDVSFDRDLIRRIALQTWQESNQTYKLIREQTKLSYMGDERGCDFLCVWFMRSYCRGLIAPVMCKEEIFSLHVQTCARLFEALFPQYATLARRCREMECAPTHDWQELQQLTLQALNVYHRLCKDYDLIEDNDGNT